MTLSTPYDMKDETLKLLDYFHRRKLTERAALAVMGVAINALIRDPITAKDYVTLLAEQLSDNLELQ